MAYSLGDQLMSLAPAQQCKTAEALGYVDFEMGSSQHFGELMAQEPSYRLERLQECICGLLISNQRLRMELIEAKAGQRVAEGLR